MEKKEPEETARLQKENAHLRRELAIEERVTERWQALADIFRDTLVRALRRYDPVCYERLQSCASEKAAGHSPAKLREPKEKLRANPKTKAGASSAQSEAQMLQLENAMLSEALAGQIKLHRKWEKTAVRFHDTLWQVLFKYEPDTYGEICPAQAKSGAPDFTGLSEAVENAPDNTNKTRWRDADNVFDKNDGRGV